MQTTKTADQIQHNQTPPENVPGDRFKHRSRGIEIEIVKVNGSLVIAKLLPSIGRNVAFLKFEIQKFWNKL